MVRLQVGQVIEDPHGRRHIVTGDGFVRVSGAPNAPPALGAFLENDDGTTHVWDGGRWRLLASDTPFPPDPHVAALHTIAEAIDGLAAAVRGERAKVRDDGR